MTLKEVKCLISDNTDDLHFSVFVGGIYSCVFYIAYFCLMLIDNTLYHQLFIFVLLLLLLLLFLLSVPCSFQTSDIQYSKSSTKLYVIKINQTLSFNAANMVFKSLTATAPVQVTEEQTVNFYYKMLCF